MLIATVETLFLAYSVISASFVSLPWYIAFDIFVGDKKTLSCLNFVSSLLLLNGMSEREYAVILFQSSVVDIDVSFLIVTVFFCPGSRSKKLSLIGKVIFAVWLVPVWGYRAVCFCEPTTWIICCVAICIFTFTIRREFRGTAA